MILRLRRVAPIGSLPGHVSYHKIDLSFGVLVLVFIADLIRSNSTNLEAIEVGFVHVLTVDAKIDSRQIETNRLNDLEVCRTEVLRMFLGGDHHGCRDALACILRFACAPSPERRRVVDSLKFLIIENAGYCIYAAKKERNCQQSDHSIEASGVDSKRQLEGPASQMIRRKP